MTSKLSSNKDNNHDSIKEEFGWAGYMTLDTYHYREFCDLIASQHEGLTLTGDFDPREVRKLLSQVEGLVIHSGAVLLIEVKNPEYKWKPTPAQVTLHRDHPVKIIETITDVEAMKPK